MARKKKAIVQTPLMKQYFRIKTQHPNALLLFRVGDFYETFSDDAVQTAAILNIALTKRANGSASSVELAGFPYHALDNYLPKLVRAGQRVAICEQLEDPKTTKKLVKRGVIELVTPGIAVNENVLENKSNNFLACVNFHKKYEQAGIAFLDMSTGEFLTAQGNYYYVDKMLNSLQPKEVLYERTKKHLFEKLFSGNFHTFELDDWYLNQESSRESLHKQFATQSLKGFGVEHQELAVVAAGAILQYLELTHHNNTGHITTLRRIEQDHHVWMDKFTIRNLELLQSLQGGKTLLDVIDQSLSPMGGRLLKRWLTLPLKAPEAINRRLNMVDHIIKTSDFKAVLEEHIPEIGDLERLASKVAMGRIQPRDVIHIKNAIAALDPVHQACLEADMADINALADQFDLCSELRQRIEKELVEDPSNQIGKGKVIAPGLSEELDQLREIAYSGKDYLNQMQQHLAKTTGISSLKIGFNNVFGYYIEVRNTYKQRVPEDWIRKQTLTSAERYVTQELAEYQSKILGAEEKILKLESHLFENLVEGMKAYVGRLQTNAQNIALIDCLRSFAAVAITHDYVKPEINDSLVIDIKAGRHPVIEQQLPIDEAYIPNDIFLDKQNQQLVIITGPNMAGKSALLRQTALIVLMAQIGCYVPAKSASIGVVDKIFTRVGASDNISQGESTFMVEMIEAASILNNLSARSLILFDELGRGTSTYDGISIAWAIVEYIHEHPAYKAKTLFATHYHELNEMANTFKRIKNYNVSVREADNKIIFLRKLKPGGSEHSFGIHVAQMAGMPQSIVKRANAILSQLEEGRDNQTVAKPIQQMGEIREGHQMSIFQLNDPVLSEIHKKLKDLNINDLTPIQALNALDEIKRLL